MRLYPFDKPIKPLYFRSFVVSVLFARFHFKIIRKSLYYTFASLPSGSCSYLFASLLFEYLFTLHQSVARLCGTKPIRYVTLHFRGWHSAVSLCFGNCAEIISLLCVNRSSIRFSLPIGAKAIRYIVNITLIWYLPNGDLVKFPFPIRELESNLLCVMFGPA